MARAARTSPGGRTPLAPARAGMGCAAENHHLSERRGPYLRAADLRSERPPSRETGSATHYQLLPLSKRRAKQIVIQQELVTSSVAQPCFAPPTGGSSPAHAVRLGA